MKVRWNWSKGRRNNIEMIPFRRPPEPIKWNNACNSQICHLQIWTHETEMPTKAHKYYSAFPFRWAGFVFLISWCLSWAIDMFLSRVTCDYCRIVWTTIYAFYYVLDVHKKNIYENAFFSHLIAHMGAIFVLLCYFFLSLFWCAPLSAFYDTEIWLFYYLLRCFLCALKLYDEQFHSCHSCSYTDVWKHSSKEKK